MLKAEICREIAMKLGYEVRAETFLGNFRYCLFLKGKRVDGSGWTEERIAWAQVENFFTDESTSARLRDHMMERMSPREWFDYLIRGFVKLKSTDLAGGRYRMAQVFAICEFLKIDIGVIENV